MGKQNPQSPILRLNAKYIAYAHTLCAYSGFLLALVLGCWLHYTKIVQNSSYGYPDEWFPSVSATIGDKYPERSVFQVMIALTAGPRFLLLFFNFLNAYSVGPKRAWTAVISGLIRTFTCGGWVYITSTDDHDWHDIFMISYMVLTIPWTLFITSTSPKGSLLKWGRGLTAFSFFATIVPLVYWFIQHKVHVVAGAYSVYAYFEWGLIFLDVAFDAWSVLDFEKYEIVINQYGAVIEPITSTANNTTTSSKTKTEVANTDSAFIDDSFCLFSFVINCINSFTLWTILTSLFLCVWFFPLWYMGISGWEAVITVYFIAPLLTAIAPLRNVCAKVPWLTRTLTVLVGLGAYKCQDPQQKLIAITIGSAFALISYVNEFNFFTLSPTKFKSYSISTVVGLLATSIFKYLNYSNNPVWPVMNSSNGGWNATGIFIALVGAFFTPRLQTTAQTRSPIRNGSFILASLGIGGWFFSIQSYLSDSGTLQSWTWEGFPIRGPTTVTGAIPHFLAIIIGLLMAIKLKSYYLTSIIWTLFGGIGAFVLFSYSHWVGYAGSLVYVTWLASLTSIILESANGFNPALVFFVGFFVNILISLASIWIVAYAFVPGGPLLRERTDIVLGLSYFLTVCGVANYKLKNIKQNNFADSSKLFKQALSVLSVLLALSVAITFKRYPNLPSQPFNSESQSFTAGIWCVHFGLDNDMWSSETRMLNLLKEAEVDVIGLLESDTQRLIGGNRDFTQKIAEELGMYVDYGPGPNKHTWGAALLSKFPIIESKHHLLPSPVGELAPAISATLDVYGEKVDVVVFHSGQEEDVEDRRLQSLGVEDIMSQSNNPMVLLSYLVTEPLQGNYFTYASTKSRMHDIDSTDWDRWCEYIMFRDLKKVGYARISRSTITDTELQIAKFKLLNNYSNRDPDFLYGNHFVPESEVEENLRFPQLFKGEGVRGHRYHVFDEPRYFADR